MEIDCRNKQIIDAELDDNQVMLRLKTGIDFGFNPVGKRIWDLIGEPQSPQESTGILSSEFEVTEEQCAREVQAFTDKAVRYDIVIER
jgi:hypothetical protein